MRSPRFLYLRDEATGRVLRRWDVTGFNWLEREKVEWAIRREHAVDDLAVVLRDSDNDAAREEA
jgi:hypothetical protein